MSDDKPKKKFNPIDNFKGKRGINSFKERPLEAKKYGGLRHGKTTTTILKELLSKDISKLTNNDTLKGLDGKTALGLQLLAIALKDETTNKDKLNAIKEILDRTEGKSVQHIETKEIDNKIEVEILTNSVKVTEAKELKQSSKDSKLNK